MSAFLSKCHCAWVHPHSWRPLIFFSSNLVLSFSFYALIVSFFVVVFNLYLAVLVPVCCVVLVFLTRQHNSALENQEEIRPRIAARSWWCSPDTFIFIIFTVWTNSLWSSLIFLCVDTCLCFCSVSMWMFLPIYLQDVFAPKWL